MGGLEERFLAVIKELQEEKRLADKRAKQLYDLTGGEDRPAFLVGVDANISNVTGDNTSYKVAWSVERFDRGGNFLSTTFTAPFDGKYIFLLGVTLDSLDSTTCERIYCNLQTSNKRYYNSYHSGLCYDTSGRMPLQWSVIADMDANDTAWVWVTASGGTRTVDISGHATNFFSFFSGALLIKEN